jgi:hypothetical protein
VWRAQRLAVAGSAPAISFNRDIRPLLADRCFKCHGPDERARKAKLRLDRAEEAYAMRPKSNDRAIVPGHPEQSLLCRRIFSTDPEEVMPPAESHLLLTPPEKELLRRWIETGAKYEPHWAFAPLPTNIEVPRGKKSKWVRNEIDAFVLARLEKEKLSPSPEASKTRWLRRVSYDLNGLPPSPEEVTAFLNDKTPLAYERVVDRLLASPRFGERMAIPWLDAARYADSYGYQSDQLCPTWPYRDWVVRAFNQNVPYDKFLTLQLAGDLMDNATREDRLATAFNRLHRQTNEGGSIEDEWRSEYVADRVNTFSTAVMGLTFECARCHDHKYDPITQRDYYSLAAFFNGIDEYGLYNDSGHVPTPTLLLPSAEQEKALDAASKDLQAKEKRLREVAREIEPKFKAWLATNAPGSRIEPACLVARFDFEDAATNGSFKSVVGATTNLSENLKGNSLGEGKTGKGIQFSGDDELNFPSLGAFEPWSQYTISFSLKLPATLTNGIIFHRSAGTDTGFHGTELSLDEGRLLFAIVRFWPGNAIAVRSKAPLPSAVWKQVAVSYDGSGRAGGMHLFLDGEPLEAEIIHDNLYKSPEAGGSGLSFGARFRSYGLKGAGFDDLSFYNRALSAIEIRCLFDGQALPDARGDVAALEEYYLKAINPEYAAAATQRVEAVQRLFAARNSVQETMVMEEMPKVRATFVLARGRYDAPKTPERRVDRGTPAFLGGMASSGPLDRRVLARWLTQPNHPLTSRVAVNRYWQMLFGRGLVATAENFGLQGAQPSHPELLDWLVRDFVSHGWDAKHALKLIVLSATYRQDSALRPASKKADPENVLLSRGPAQRLPAEMIRDTALAASGLLAEAQGGPPVNPYAPGDIWRESNSMSPAYTQSHGKDLYRRSLYTTWKRTAQIPNMGAFDAPSREVCVIRRSATVTPQQGFVLLNDPQFVEASRVLAEKALAQFPKAPEQMVPFIFRRLTAREPAPEETRLLLELFKEQAAIFASEPGRATNLLKVGEHKPEASLDPIQVAAATSVAQAVLNLDATVWKR